eukprot:TRINITY_DN70770_c0_g1_i1.p1 TRINITY_DN70770_c0_g1~~TRINITY_DN70770_c0_g1_i1.p1  ORF type:complete len:507 (+),score=122.80 TRINITY_DN70770_c0_g1_i1:71-1591(+)
MSLAVSVRRCSAAADVSAALQLLPDGTAGSEWAAALRSAAAEPGNGDDLPFVFVAEIDGCGAVGCAVAAASAALRSEAPGDLADVAVHAEVAAGWRRRGVGSSLLRAAIAALCRTGCSAVHALSTLPSDCRAFLHAGGFDTTSAATPVLRLRNAAGGEEPAPGPAARLVTVVGDDFGVNPRRTQGILDGLTQGTLTAVAALPNGSCTEAALCAAARRGLLTPAAVGLHINLTEGVPCSHPAEVPSLVGADGRFLGKHGMRRRLLQGGLRPEEIVLETRRQIAVLRSMLVTAFGPSAAAALRHADGHHHIGVLPELAPLFAALLRSEGFDSTRIPYDGPLLGGASAAERRAAQTPLSPAADLSHELMGRPFWLRVSEEARAAAPVYHQHGVRFAARFCGLTMMGADCSAPQARSAVSLHAADRWPVPDLAGGFPGVAEVMTHVGRTALPQDVGPDPDPFHYCFFSRLADRDHELAVWTSAEVGKALRQLTPSGFCGQPVRRAPRAAL